MYNISKGTNFEHLYISKDDLINETKRKKKVWWKWCNHWRHWNEVSKENSIIKFSFKKKSNQRKSVFNVYSIYYIYFVKLFSCFSFSFSTIFKWSSHAYFACFSCTDIPVTSFLIFYETVIHSSLTREITSCRVLFSYALNGIYVWITCHRCCLIIDIPTECYCILMAKHKFINNPNRKHIVLHV